jgi:hypothetical protein
MQISRRILLACVATAILLPNLLHAETEAQKKARQALEQKMRELDSQPVGTPPPAARPPAVVPPAQPERRATPPQAAPVPQPRPAPAAATADVEKARQALREKMQTLETQPATTSAPTTWQPAPATTAQPAPVATAQPAPMTEPAQAAFFEPIPEAPAVDIERARQALREKTSQVDPPAASEEAKAKPTSRSKGPEVLQPIQGPPTGLPPAKEERLKGLLDLYKADKLTPQQYHAERAKILSEP